MTRTRLALTLCSLATLAGLSALMLLDSSPSPQSLAWQAAFEERRSQPSESYLLLLGLDAAAMEQPMQLGRARLDAYHAWTAAGEKNVLVLPDTALLPVPDNEQLCEPGKPECLARSADGSLNGTRLLAENAVLLERYRLWLELAPARSQALPGASEPLPNHRLLMVANRLLGLQALQLIEQGNPRAALELLQQDIVRLRRQLAEADTLIGKIIVASMLSADLERIALWHARGLLPDPAPIAGLSESERSLLMPMQHEFSGIARLFGNLRQLGLEEHGALPLLLFYKPQRSINQALPSYQYPAELSQLPPDRLAQVLAEREPMEPVSPWSQPNNPIGQILLNIATPAFENYAGRVQDLDARIRLFNLLGQLPDEESELLAALTTLPGADNPYYPGQPPRWDATTGTLCFDGPLPDERGVRCLPLR